MMTMRLVWLVGADGPVQPPVLELQLSSIAAIYRDVPSQYRYAVGYIDGELTIIDLYLTKLIIEHPFIVPHFVEKYVDMDQAVAALTIGYDQSNRLVTTQALSKRIQKARGIHEVL